MYDAGVADLPAREQARAGGADVGARGVRRRDPAVVASHRVGARGPAAVRDGRAAVRAGMRSTRTYLINREPVATVGLLWSQRSVDFHGKDDPETTSLLPYRGWVDALIRARIPYLPIHEVDQRLAVIIVPNVGVLTDAQCEALTAYVEGGGRLVVTGESGLYDEWGDRRDESALAELLGVRHQGKRLEAGQVDWETYGAHSYLRIEDRGIADGFGDTDLLPFGGQLEVVEASGAAVTYVPPFPIYPPELSWMAEPRTDVPVRGARRADGVPGGGPGPAVRAVSPPRPRTAAGEPRPPGGRRRHPVAGGRRRRTRLSGLPAGRRGSSCTWSTSTRAAPGAAGWRSSRPPVRSPSGSGRAAGGRGSWSRVGRRR